MIYIYTCSHTYIHTYNPPIIFHYHLFQRSHGGRPFRIYTYICIYETNPMNVADWTYSPIIWGHFCTAVNEQNMKGNDIWNPHSLYIIYLMTISVAETDMRPWLQQWHNEVTPKVMDEFVSYLITTKRTVCIILNTHWACYDQLSNHEHISTRKWSII